MNDPASPAPIPPQPPTSPVTPAATPPPVQPAHVQPMWVSPPPRPPRPRETGLKFTPMEGGTDLGSVLQALLKQPGSLLHALHAGGPGTGAVRVKLALILVVCLAIYGVVMGSLSGGVQLWAAPLKLTLGMLASLLICLPSLYIFLCLSGADLRLGHVAGAALGMAAMLSLLLVGFAPVAWIFSQSTDSVALMGALHLTFWMIGMWFGVRLVAGLLEYPVRADGSHVRVWVLIFALVSLQMATVLRPLIGTSEHLLPVEKKFFVTHWLETLGGRSEVHPVRRVEDQSPSRD